MKTSHYLPRVVVIGGGTGMPTILRGIKNLPIDLTALVTVADNGGSTGRLRSELNIPAPGDIRNCLAALANTESIFLDLFQHRFQQGTDLAGHVMGNLVLVAMSTITGDFYQGIEELSRLLQIKGKILPTSIDDVTLNAEMIDGTIVCGESEIPAVNKRIHRVFLDPHGVAALPEAIEAIEAADLIIISPGSLYTSILPNLIVPNIQDAIQATKAKVVYFCNVMTEAGETTSYSASDHVQALYDHVGRPFIDSVVVHNEDIACCTRKKYESEDASPVHLDYEQLLSMDIEVIEGDIIDYTDSGLRHNEEKVAQLIRSILAQ